MEESAEEISRPIKRRKFYRKRVGSGSEDDTASIPAEPLAASTTARPDLLTIDELVSQNAETAGLDDDQAEATTPSMAEILRQRKAAQRRRGGIAFTNTSITTESLTTAPNSRNEILEDGDSLDKIMTVVDRFKPQTGLVADVDKHM